MAEGKVSAAQFSFRLGDTGASELYLGGMNAAQFVSGTTQWASVTSQSYWTVVGTAFSGGTAVLGGFHAIIDTGTTVIIVSPSFVPYILIMAHRLHQAPTASAEAYYASVSGSSAYGGGYYTFE